MAESAREDASILARRRFLNRLILALTGLGGIIVGVPFVGAWLEPLLRANPRVWRLVGRVDRFKVGTTVEVTFPDAAPLPWTGVSAENGVWLRREDAQSFVAFSLYCQHLGCPVRWEPQAQLFFCPCHGGVYYANGAVAAGPPPRALQQYPVRVRDGQVEVRTSDVPFTY